MESDDQAHQMSSPTLSPAGREGAVVDPTVRRTTTRWEWLLAADIVGVGGLLVAYLIAYAGGSQGRWRTIVGYNFDALTRAQAAYVLRYVPVYRIIETKPAVGTTVGIIGVVALGALALLVGERRFMLRRSRSVKLVPFALVAVVAAVVGAYLEYRQIRNIPQFVLLDHPGHHFALTGFGTSQLILGFVLIAHLAVALGFAVAVWVAAVSGRVTAARPGAVSLARGYWVWLLSAIAVVSIVMLIWY